MNHQPKKVELLAPAGNPEKLDIAIHYGADAVYLADRRFSLRNAADNFTDDQLKAAADATRKHGVRMYVACNIYARTAEADALCDYFHRLSAIGPDGLIIADPGVLQLARTTVPGIPIHLSTQANTTSLNAVHFWEQQGVSRINLARELSLAEIREIAGQTSVQIETFVHGAMCMAYSGRCLLSGFFTGRESNRGMCSHPCRWQYHVVEETRPGVYMPILEDNRGTYILSSKDLCMIEHMDKLIDAGIASLKIEGRMKSVNYLASTVKVYREAIDAYYDHPEKYRVQSRWIDELAAINNRGFSTGFYFGDPGSGAINYTDAAPGPEHRFIAKVLGTRSSGRILAAVKNKICTGDTIEVLTRKGPTRPDTVLEISDPSGIPLDAAMPNSTAILTLSGACGPNDLIRRLENEPAP